MKWLHSFAIFNQLRTFLCTIHGQHTFRPSDVVKLCGAVSSAVSHLLISRWFPGSCVIIDGNFCEFCSLTRLDGHGDWMSRPGNHATDAIGQIPGRRDRFADDSSLVQWTKREGDLFKVHSASSLNDQSKLEIYKQEDQWSRRPSPVHLDWRNKLQQPDDLGIYLFLRSSLFLKLHRYSQGRGNLNADDVET